MKFRYTYLIWAGCLWLGVAGCASSGMNKKVAVTPVRTLTPDSMSTVGVDVNIHIPERPLQVVPASLLFRSCCRKTLCWQNTLLWCSMLLSIVRK